MPRLPDEPGPWTIDEDPTGDDPGRLSRVSPGAADFTVLIAPETSGILASLTRELEQRGARLLGSTAEAVELTADKARLGCGSKHSGSTRPRPARSCRPRVCRVDTVYPAVLKPVDGAGSMDTFYLADARQFARVCAGDADRAFCSRSCPARR